MGALKIRQRLLVDNLGGGGPIVSPGPLRLVAESGVSISSAGVPLRRERISLAGVSIAVLASEDYGGTKLAEFAAEPSLIIATRLQGLITVSAGLDTTLAAGNVDIGAGTAEASATTLATTMINLVPKIDIPAGGAVFGAGITPLGGSGVDVWINASAACAADSVITFGAGSFLDLLFADVGQE